MACNKDSSRPEASRGRCPICGDPAEVSFRPFCSARCRDVDLSRWLSGSYAIPGGHADADEDGEDAAARQAPTARGGVGGEDEDEGE
jgi:endogenous inhibitor of DNA gyrase (YacG/DUF329 family)